MPKDALEAIKGVKWIPDWGEARIAGMVNGRPDWCISRQRTWGVPIALFVNRETGEPHPRSVELMRGALATSGDYARCIVLDGVRYGHLLHPRTGWPVRHLASVSVVGELCVLAGSAATIAMLEQEAGPAWLESLGLACHWVDVDGREGGTLITAGAAEPGA